MTIELMDVDVPYEVSIDVTENCDSIIKIIPNSAMQDRCEDYDICLDAESAKELIRVLDFLVKEIE